MKKIIQNIIESKNPDEINEWLIEIGKQPEEIKISEIKQVIKKKSAESIFPKILLNLAWILGEISDKAPLDDDLIELLIEKFYKSDRWVRNEIIKTFQKFSNNYSNQEFFMESILNLLGNAIFDDYQPIALNSLKALLNYSDLPSQIIAKIFKLLKKEDKEISNQAVLILRKFINSEESLVEFLNEHQIYIDLNPKAIRNILLGWFQNIIRLESFRDAILNAKWQKDKKDLFLKEIDVYQKILIRAH